MSNYVLGPGDAINIQVYGEDDLSIEFMLDSSGSFDYPYLASSLRQDFQSTNSKI